MMEDTEKGRLTILGAVAVLLISAWWIESFAPYLNRWVAVLLASLLGLYLHLAYRGFRWLVAGALLFIGASIAFTLVIHTGRLTGSRGVPLTLLGIACVLFAAFLTFSRTVGAYLSERRAVAQQTQRQGPCPLSPTLSPKGEGAFKSMG